MKAILFGLPISTHRRLLDESEGWSDAVPVPHQFISKPISTNERLVFTEGELKDLAETVGQGFTHVIIPASRDWKAVSERFRFDCRVHLARLRQPIRDIRWELLKERLHAAVRLDEAWLAKLCPADLRHALLLPPLIFSTTRNTERYWHRCDVYSEEQIREAEELLSVVEREHRKPDRSGVRGWIDARRLRYKIDQSKHGLSSSTRAKGKTFRFCYEVPPGFHYDVTDDDGRTFIIDINGKAEKLAHCNITPWGHVRKG